MEDVENNAGAAARRKSSDITTKHTTRQSSIVTVDHDRLRRTSVLTDLDLKRMEDRAAAANTSEQSMTLVEGMKSHPRAVLWSAFLSTCIIMEGYDKALMYSLLTLEPFRRQFGTVNVLESYTISASWQSGLINAAVGTEIVGLYASGILADKLGYRMTIVTALTLLSAFVTVQFVASSLPVLLVGQALMGLPWGVFQAIATSYAAEVCPVALRAYVTTYVNLCWVLGQLVAAGVISGMSARTDNLAFRLPIALQWAWPLPIMIGLYFAPESPWWLIRRGRREDSKQALRRLMKTGNHDADTKVDDTIALMEHTDLLEKAHSSGTRYRDCFKTSDLRRTEIACCSWAVQNLCGSTLINFATYFFMGAGMSSDRAYTMSTGMYGVGAVGTLISWILMANFGRRTLYLSGLYVMCALLVAVGACGFISIDDDQVMRATGALLMVFTFTYDATVGPVCYSLVAELSSNRLRAKTIALARMVYNITGVLTNVLTPMMLSPDVLDWGGKAGVFWAASCGLCAVWCYFRLPEPKGRTYGDLDVLFERGISARKFKSTQVEPFVVGGQQVPPMQHSGAPLSGNCVQRPEPTH